MRSFSKAPWEEHLGVDHLDQAEGVVLLLGGQGQLHDPDTPRPVILVHTNLITLDGVESILCGGK